MATKASENARESTETREETADGPLMDGMSAPVKKMVQKAKERGYVTYDELNAVLPPDQMSSEQIEDTMAMLSEMGITVIESEEQDDSAADEEEKSPSAAGNLNDDDIGRTDDPVRMYLREMGSVELLSREGEIAIAKRIEAGREKMIGGICESPLTIKALLFWRESLIEGRILLRDIIDLDATYGGGPDDEDIAREESGEADKELEEAEVKEGEAKQAQGTEAKEQAKALPAETPKPRQMANGEDRGAQTGGAEPGGAKPGAAEPGAQGAPSQGAPSQGAPSQGAPSQGPPSQGPPSQGPPSQGAPRQGTRPRARTARTMTTRSPSRSPRWRPRCCRRCWPPSTKSPRPTRSLPGPRTSV